MHMTDSKKDNLSDNDPHLAISSFEHWYGTPLGEHGAGRQDFWADVIPIFGLVVDEQLALHSSDVVQSVESFHLNGPRQKPYHSGIRMIFQLVMHWAWPEAL